MSFLVEQLRSRAAKMRHGASREKFVPFSSRHFSLNGFQNYFAERAVLLPRVPPKPVMEFFRNVLDLDIGHGRNDSMPSACRQDARFGKETDLGRPRVATISWLFLGCCPGGLKTRLVAVDADDGHDVELELVELLDKFLHPGGQASPDRREG